MGNVMKGTPGGTIGYSVCISCDGKTIAFGSFSGDIERQVVSVYSWDGTDWNLVGSSIAGEASSHLYRQTVSLSCDGKTVAAGAVASSNDGFNEGRVRVFKWDDDDVWIQVGTDIDGGKAYEETGYSLSLSSDGTKVIIGAHYNGDIATDAGAARIFSIGTGSFFSGVIE